MIRMYNFTGKKGNYYNISFIKFNYKCPKGTIDDSNKCYSELESPNSVNELYNNEKYSNLLNTVNKTEKAISDADGYDALQEYSEYGYIDVSNDLRNGDTTNQISLQIDDIFKQDDARLIDNITVFRGIRIFNDDNSVDPKKESLLQSLKTKDSVINEKTFLSTSLISKVADKFGEVKLILDVPKGNKAIYIGKINSYIEDSEDEEGESQGEAEMLLDRNQNIQITEPLKPDPDKKGRYIVRGIIKNK